MSVKKFTAVSSAAVLTAGTLLVSAGAAGAQGSSEIADDLDLAATALNGPVTVTANADSGPTVSYTNDTDADQRCAGFTMPYTTIDDEGIDPNELDMDDPLGAMATLMAIDDAGDVSILFADEEGQPFAFDSDPGEDHEENGIWANLSYFAIGSDVDNPVYPDGPAGVSIPPGASVTWEATLPNTPAAAAILCQPPVDDPEEFEPDLDTHFGVDPQVVADQINDRLGPLGSIGAGSISGGSVDIGADIMGSIEIPGS